MVDNRIDLAVVGRRVLTARGFEPAAVLISDGQIADVVKPADVPSGCAVEKADDDIVVMPGIIDTHVHVNEPGRTEWEGFETATKAAAAGGVTAIVDMPLNCIPVTTTLEALRTKLDAIRGLLRVDCGFWGGVVPGNADSLQEMVEAGVLGFKCFLIHSGIDDFPNVQERDLRIAMPILAKLGVPLLVHAELDCGASACASEETLSKAPRSYRAYLDSRPRRWENDAVKLMCRLQEEFKGRVHIVHLSSSDAVPFIRENKAKGMSLTAETCPHYLTFAAEQIPDGDTRYKCAPPIREGANADRLWSALQDGTIDFIVSDHSPCTPELKLLEEGDFQRAWGGIASLQFGLPAVWTEARQRGFSLADVSRWMSAATASFVGLEGRKGRIAKGFDADLVFFAPDETFQVDKKQVYHRHKETPHEGRTFTGLVKKTYLRGTKVFENGNFSTSASGQFLLRGKVEAPVS